MHLGILRRDRTRVVFEFIRKSTPKLKNLVQKEDGGDKKLTLSYGFVQNFCSYHQVAMAPPPKAIRSKSNHYLNSPVGAMDWERTFVAATFRVR